jgi:hypothetical protein
MNSFLTQKLGISFDTSKKHCAVHDVEQILKLQRKAIQENLEDQSQFDHIGMKVK